jgi:ectoine hydroxylase-related dioxygenase (phytanoyl-CoA dioxygenase family)
MARLLSERECEQFRTVGFVVLRQFFSPVEVENIVAPVEHVLRTDRSRRYRMAADGIEYDMENLPFPGTAAMSLERYAGLAQLSAAEVNLRVELMRMRTSVGEVAEQQPTLGEQLLADDKVWDKIAQLLGEDFIFTGSEVMCGSFNEWHGQGWHSDRGMAPGGSDLDELAWQRAKLLMYPGMKTTAGAGALRVIPASHRPPLHGELTRMIQTEGFDQQTAHGELLPLIPASMAMDAGIMEQQRQRLAAGELPYAFCFESNPGDVLCFNHCLMHAVYHKPEDRAFVAVKFAARPNGLKQWGLYSSYYHGGIDTAALDRSPHRRLRELAARERSLVSQWDAAAEQQTDSPESQPRGIEAAEEEQEVPDENRSAAAPLSLADVTVEATSAEIAAGKLDTEKAQRIAAHIKNHGFALLSGGVVPAPVLEDLNPRFEFDAAYRYMEALQEGGGSAVPCLGGSLLPGHGSARLPRSAPWVRGEIVANPLVPTTSFVHDRSFQFSDVSLTNLEMTGS